MLPCTHLGRAVRRQQHQPGGLATPRQRRDQIQRREVSPVQVLENKNQCFLGGHGFDGIAYFIQQPLAPRRSGHRRRTVAVERSELRIPARGLLLYHAHMFLALAGGTELSQGFDHRIISFLAGEPFHTLAARDTHMVFATSLAAEQVDQRGFSNACLPGDEDHLPLALGGMPQQYAEPLEFLPPSYDAPRLRPRRVHRVPAAILDLRQKPIAAPRNSSDKSGGLYAVSQPLAQLDHISAQHLWLHIRLWPQFVQQLIVRHQPLGVFDKITQHGKRLRSQADPRAILPQAFVPGVELKAAKFLHWISGWIKCWFYL